MQTGVEYWSAPTDLSGSIVRYQVDDVLNITVNAVEEPIIAADFNLPLQPLANTENSGEDNVPQGTGRQSYRVNRQGEIDFPVLGLIKVEGLTEAELEALLKESLRRYLKTVPIISIRMQDFRISVLGEVGRPGQYNVTKNNINIFEALSLAGDMSIYGQRDKVKLMRVLSTGETNILISIGSILISVASLIVMIGK